MTSSKARGEMEPESYPSSPARPRAAKTARFPGGYVEDCGETRTTLEVSFTARLAEEGHYG